VFAQAWNGTGSFKSLARSLRYPFGGFQTPERSGFPSANRGAGAARLGFPSGVRGMAGGRTFVHCANAGTHISVIVANRSVSFIRLSCRPTSSFLYDNFTDDVPSKLDKLVERRLEQTFDIAMRAILGSIFFSHGGTEAIRR